MYREEIKGLRALGRTEDEIKAIVEEDRLLDERSCKAAMEDWVNLLVKMWDAVDKAVDERRLKVYVEEFKAVPLGLLEKSVSRAIRNNGAWLTVPSVGALWAAIRKETGDLPNMDVMEAVQLWMERQAGFIYRFEKVTA